MSRPGRTYGPALVTPCTGPPACVIRREEVSQRVIMKIGFLNFWQYAVNVRRKCLNSYIGFK